MMRVRHAVLLGVLLALLPVAHAVGFGNLPSNREITFQPNGEAVIPFYMINGQHLFASITSTTQGDPTTRGTPQDDNILDYVTIDDPAPGTGPREIAVHFRFPQQLRPGMYYIDVYATDRPTGGQSSGATAAVTAIATVKLRLTLWVLSPDPLLHMIGVSTPPVPEGINANATVTYASRTTQALDGVTATVMVSKDGMQVAAATSPPFAIPSAQHSSVIVQLPTSQLQGGEYDITAALHYADGLNATGGTVLKIGTLHVAIPAYTQEIAYNETNRFRFNISNQWNRALQEVYADVRIGQQTKKTASLDIPPFGQTEYEVYFDRDAALPSGPGTVDTTITFKDYDTNSQMYVGKQEMFSLPITILTPPVQEQPLQLRDALTWGLGIAVLVLLIVLLTFRRQGPKPQVASAAASAPAPPTQGASPPQP